MPGSMSSFSIFTGCLIAVFSFVSCKDIPRDNLLDPKNPGSYRAQIIAVEAFVNTENNEMYNEYMLSALKTVEQHYSKKITIADYHRNLPDNADSLSNPLSEYVYEDYVDQFDSQKGVPDVFINGATIRIKGASSADNATNRLESALQPLLIQNSYFTIEPQVTRRESIVRTTVKIARLGSIAAEDFFVRMTLVEKIDNNMLRNVVRHIETSNLIPGLEPGEQKEFSFADLEVQSGRELSVIFTVMSNNDKIIHQSVEVDVP
jgi:hypothetical protein